jgi:hypothetical protein
MYKVKLSIAADNVGCARQTPGGQAIWGNYQFFINQEIEEADFWVVYSKGERKTESCKVSPENTLFITGEPETIYHYAKGFVNQFKRIVVCQNNIKHPNQIHYQPAQPWHIGKVYNGENKVVFRKTYDDFAKTNEYPKKKLISVISSKKAFTKGHQNRIDFVLKLKNHFGDQIDLFGRGFNPIDDKWDVIAPYKYHIAIENSAYPDYWTEKLADCYLGGTYPLYHGCTNLDRYFDDKAFSSIDINNFDKSIATIEQVLKDNLFEKRQVQLKKAKELVLDKYNIFQLIASQLDDMNPDSPKTSYTIKQDTAFFDLKKIQTMVLPRLINSVKMKLK